MLLELAGDSKATARPPHLIRSPGGSGDFSQALSQPQRFPAWWRDAGEAEGTSTAAHCGGTRLQPRLAQPPIVAALAAAIPASPVSLRGPFCLYPFPGNSRGKAAHMLTDISNPPINGEDNSCI